MTNGDRTQMGFRDAHKKLETAGLETHSKITK